MKFIERFSGIFLIAGFLLFTVAFLSLGVAPAMMVNRMEKDGGLPLEVPEAYRSEYPDAKLYQAALLHGRDLYVGEGCWHCHSQFVRPTANENLRYGPVSTPGEYQNVLNLPQLFGVRRVGPDLSRESGRHTDDWHYAHLYKPTNVVPESVMPSYAWYFATENGVPVPTKDAKAIVAYLQWLGAKVVDRKETVNDYDQETLPPKE